MMNLFQTKFTFTFGSSSYVLNQNPNSDVTIEDPTTIEGVLGSDGTPVYFPANQGEPIRITASAIGIGFSLLNFFSGEGGIWEQNLNGSGLFSLTIEGFDSKKIAFRYKYIDCSFAKKPMKVAFNQDVPEIQFEVICANKKDNLSAV